MPGMLALHNSGRYRERIGETRRDGVALSVHATEIRDEWTPDLDDAATLGAVLALVREAWGDPGLCAVPNLDGGWIMAVALCHSMLSGGRYFKGATEAEALIAALEAAPVRS